MKQDMKRENKIICFKDNTMILAWYIHTEHKTVQFTVLVYSFAQTSTSSFVASFLPSDLGYHADKPEFDEQKDSPCNIRASGRCYYDGTSLGAISLWKEFLASSNDEVIWKALEERC